MGSQIHVALILAFLFILAEAWHGWLGLLWFQVSSSRLAQCSGLEEGVLMLSTYNHIASVPSLRDAALGASCRCIASCRASHSHAQRRLPGALTRSHDWNFPDLKCPSVLQARNFQCFQWGPCFVFENPCKTDAVDSAPVQALGDALGDALAMTLC